MAKDTYIPRDELIDMNEEFKKVSAEVEKELLKYPGVVAVGAGMIVTGGELQRELCFKVSVVKKKSIGSLKKSERIPKTILGFKTDVVEVPHPVPLGSDGRRYRPLMGGIQVSNSKSLSIGTLGCLAKMNLGNKIVALSNWHVMMSKHDVMDNEKVGQPWYNGCCCCVCGEIGEVIDGRLNTNMDAAIALLAGQSGDPNSEVRYINEIHSIGVITGSEEHLPGETVYKRGRTTKLTVGQIENVNTPLTVPYKSYNNHSQDFEGQLTICPSFPYTDMILGGDSGSVLVNEHNKVVGLNFAGTDEKIRPRPSILMAYASPITPILDALKISILDSTFASTSDKKGVPLGGSTFPDKIPSLQESLDALEKQLNDYHLGKYLLETFRQHSVEVLALINNNREVMVSWNKYQGPAFISNIIRSIKRKKTIPDQIHGISLQNLLLKMTAVLQRNGSENLVEEVNKNYLIVMEILGAGHCIEEWMIKLQELNHNYINQTLRHA